MYTYKIISNNTFEVIGDNYKSIFNGDKTVAIETINKLTQQVINEVKQQLIEKINNAYSAKIKEIASKYPNTERDTWNIQQSEWTSWVQDSQNSKTPFVDTLAKARGITREEMLEKIGENVKLFAYLLGLKQQFLDKTNNATTENELESIEEGIKKTFASIKV